MTLDLALELGNERMLFFLGAFASKTLDYLTPE